MPWYTGPTLLEYLEEVPVGARRRPHKPFRLPVQRVIRPDHHYRGFAGQIAAGTIRKGDTIVALPSGRTSRVASITTFDGDLEEASAPQSIALTLEDELDISRGDVIADPAQPAAVRQRHRSTPRLVRRTPASKTTSPTCSSTAPRHSTPASPRVLHRTNIQTLEEEAVHSLGMNDIGVVEVATTTRPSSSTPTPTTAPPAASSSSTPQPTHTAAAGMIRRSHRHTTRSAQHEDRRCSPAYPGAGRGNRSRRFS